MSDYVRCSRCGKRVSNVAPVELTVRAWVECPECIEEIAAQRPALATLLLAHLPGESVITEQITNCRGCNAYIDGRSELTREEAERAWADHVAEVIAAAEPSV